MDENDEILEIWASLPKDIREILSKAMEESSAVTDEQFIAEIMIGQCSRCGSKNTKDCEEIEGIEDSTVGLCMNCGHLWCSQCGRPMKGNASCRHWDICDECEESNEMGLCESDPMECERLRRALD
jgi:hypothetical protein